MSRAISCYIQVTTGAVTSVGSVQSAPVITTDLIPMEAFTDVIDARVASINKKGATRQLGSVSLTITAIALY